MKANIPRYLATWSEELSSRANRVRLLIGNAHWLSDGHHKEFLIREFLGRHLPPQFSVTRGFIRPPDESDRCSPEIDVLVSNPELHPPFFNEGGLVITVPSACIAYIEVKTNFEKKSLLEALSSQIETQKILTRYSVKPQNVWRGITMFNMPESRTLKSAGETLGECLEQCYESNKYPDFCSLLPNSLAVLDKMVFFLQSKSNNVCQIRGFTLQEVSLSALFTDLFSHIRITHADSRPTPNELDTLLQSINPTDSWASDFKINH
jgi:hypothetical protein